MHSKVTSLYPRAGGRSVHGGHQGPLAAGQGGVSINWPMKLTQSHVALLHAGEAIGQTIGETRFNDGR